MPLLVPISERNAGDVRASSNATEDFLLHRQPEAAVGLGHRQAEQAELAHLRDDVGGDRVVVGDAMLVRDQPLAHEAPDARRAAGRGFPGRGSWRSDASI